MDKILAVLFEPKGLLICSLRVLEEYVAKDKILSKG